MKRYLITLPDLRLLSQLISALDDREKCKTTQERRMIEAGHAAITRALAEDAKLVYDTEEA